MTIESKKKEVLPTVMDEGGVRGNIKMRELEFSVCL